MYTDKAEIQGKRGVKELEHNGYFYVIANRFLYEHGKSSRFALVDVHRKGVDDVYSSVEAAHSALKASQ